MGDAKTVTRRRLLRNCATIAGSLGVGSVAASDSSAARSQTLTGYVCGDRYASGERFTVAECPLPHSCDAACAPRTLSPECEDDGGEDGGEGGDVEGQGDGDQDDDGEGGEGVYRPLRDHPDCLGIYVAPETAVPDGTYEVVETRACESAASECDGEDLHLLAFRPVDG